jgi:hypothetical protein
LRGAAHQAAASGPPSSTRRVVTFPLLLTLGTRIATSPWDPVTKQVVWAACTTAFFSSARLGELLACSDLAHDPTSDLTWADVKSTSSTSILLRFKSPKSGEKEGEFVDLFSFPGYHCCPVAALRNLWSKQHSVGQAITNLPVFRFPTGVNLTTARFNSILASLLHDICTPGVNTISCHSFRPGIPSTLSLFPDLATSDHIKGWGRWKSDCYTLYTRLQLGQREQIFAKIATALQSTQPSPFQQ